MARWRLLLGVAGALAMVVVAAGVYLAAIARTGTGYTAQTICSAVFISGRDPASLYTAEFEGLHPLLKQVSAQIDRDRKTVRANLFGLGSQESVYRPGLGCTLTDLESDLSPPQTTIVTPRVPPSDFIAQGVVPLPAGVDSAKLKSAVDEEFAETDGADARRTRALLVVLGGHLIVERYAPGFSKDMPLAGYSMTKTITGALAGILVGRGLLDPKALAPVPLWRRPGDPHAAITIDNLLHMTAGLKWTEDSGDPRSDVLLMAYHYRDFARYAEESPMEYPAGTHFAYNSGATNILARILLTALHEDREAYLSFPRTALFDPAGMSSAMLAPDASGTLFGSTQAFATARDWARFGELYLHDGARDGVQILPKGWVAYSATPEPAGADRGYGALIWVNRGKPSSPQTRPSPEIPEDALMMTGQFGQLTAVVPSFDVVIVRLGESHKRDLAKDRNRLIANILSALLRP